ncbi:MAG: MBL fold metallo-hydrolase [Armatimonadetes bacterium]|nr:MBL fold metallo-hydrolase [Armatimonadota bacterium]MDW8121443.1 MBL fold metallo-hydrolase [Armatimonadota bacterium]
MTVGPIFIRRFVVSPLQSNCYLVGCQETREGIIIDPGDSCPDLEKAVNEMGLAIRYLLATHGHFDHILGARPFKTLFGATFLMPEKDWSIAREADQQAFLFGWNAPPVPEPDGFLKEGDVLFFGHYRLEVWQTPGHSPGHLCFLLSLEPLHLFSGDLLFSGSVGRTDFPGGDPQAMKQSLKRILTLPESTIVHPGHGPETTIGQEKASNPFLAFEP